MDKTVKHMPTELPFGTAGPIHSLTRTIDSKYTLGTSGLAKIKTTKKQGFNFSHPSTTMNFNNYESITPISRAPVGFRLFNLSKSGFSGSAKGFKMPNFVFIFVQKYREGHKSVKSVNPLSMKMMIKQINTFYTEKVNQAKDSVNIRNATMLEFVYEYLQNKYGKTPILERKVKEILLTTLFNESKYKYIKLFGKFLGITISTGYTNDDLSMYYNLNRLFYINDVYVDGNFAKREFNFNSSKMNVGRVVDQVKLYFSGKCSMKTLNKIISDVIDKAINSGDSKPKPQHPSGERDLYTLKIDCELVYFSCIKAYQTSKTNIVNYLIEKELITYEYDEFESNASDNEVIQEKEENMEESFSEESKNEFLEPSPRKNTNRKELDIKGMMLDLVYSFDEFKNIFNSISQSIQFTSDSLEVIFNKYGLFKGEEKKITLESITAILFKFEILAL